MYTHVQKCACELKQIYISLSLFLSLSLSQTTYSESKGGVGLPGLVIAIVLCEIHPVSSSNCDISRGRVGLECRVVLHRQVILVVSSSCVLCVCVSVCTCA